MKSFIAFQIFDILWWFTKIYNLWILKEAWYFIKILESINKFNVVAIFQNLEIIYVLHFFIN